MDIPSMYQPHVDVLQLTSRTEVTGIVFSILSVPENYVLHLPLLFKCLIICLYAHLNYYIQFSTYASRDGIDPTRRRDRPSYKHSSHSTVGFPPLGVRALLQEFFSFQGPDNAAPQMGYPTLESKCEHNSAVGIFPTQRNYL